MKILGIAGSLRRASYNRALVEAARDVAPAGMRIEPFDLDDIPLYNADFDLDGLRPAEVDVLKQAVTEADGLLIATPEYNHSVPGVLQNAIDWASRPALQSPHGLPSRGRGALLVVRARVAVTRCARIPHVLEQLRRRGEGLPIDRRHHVRAGGAELPARIGSDADVDRARIGLHGCYTAGVDACASNSRAVSFENSTQMP